MDHTVLVSRAINITSLKVGDFDGLSALRSLDLSDNDLRTLPVGVFDGLSALTDLELSDNDLKTLPVGVFDGLTALTYLELRNNDLKTLPSGVFDETKTSYTVTVSVSDGNSGTDSIDVTINVTDVSEGTTYNVGDTIPSFAFPTGTFIFGDTLSAGNKVSTCVSAGNCTVTNGEVTQGTIEESSSNGAPVGTHPPKSALFSNCPNPFNPETWIPYQLANPTEVTLTIYDMRGVVVRTIALGHQPAGMYTSRSRAIHWDGRNSIGEKVATGVY